MDNVWSTKRGYLSRKYNEHFTQLGALLKREQVDILFVTLQIIFIPPLNVKIITPVHDLMHRYERRFPEVGGAFAQREKIFSLQARCADVILTDSEMGKKQYIESYGNIMKKNQKVVSLPFVAPGYIREIKEAFIETPDKYIFYPAQFWQHKNHLNLVKAVEMIKDDIPDIKLLLCGSKKNYYYEVKNYIEDHHLEKYVQICGYVSNEQMTYLYKHATAMFMPSFFGPTNIPPLEAMELGCPVAVANNYGMPEQVGEGGLTFDPGKPEEIAQCIRKIWNDEPLRQSLIHKGYEQAAKWTAEDFKSKVLDIVENI
jgi:glycosyltransferase involved in cell wall biosynthesis